MQTSELATPAALIDLNILQDNLRRAVQVCRTNGVQYRPHIKTHKIPKIAQLQMQAGACGITCAKVSEAEVMARAGLNNIFIANCLVDEGRFERVRQLSRGCRVAVGVDSREAAQAMSRFFQAHAEMIEVVMEIDTGHHRCGLTPECAPELASWMASLPSIRLKGIFTHEGHVYQHGSSDERLARAKRAGEQMVEVAAHLRERGFAIEVVSVGSSPARDAACRIAGVTENRPGTNILNDCTQVYLGACEWGNCALTYECTVVSRPAPDRAIIDGGSKTFSSDQLSDWGDIGAVKGYPGAKFSRVSEEHGILSLTDDRSQCMRIGQRVRVIPTHACGSINLHDRAFAVRDGEIVEEWKIEARGCVD